MRTSGPFLPALYHMHPNPGGGYISLGVPSVPSRTELLSQKEFVPKLPDLPVYFSCSRMALRRGAEQSHSQVLVFASCGRHPPLGAF